MMMLGTAGGLEGWLSTISRLDYCGGKGKSASNSLSLSYVSLAIGKID